MSVNDSITHVETVKGVEDKSLGNSAGDATGTLPSSIRMPLVDALRSYFKDHSRTLTGALIHRG